MEMPPLHVYMQTLDINHSEETHKAFGDSPFFTGTMSHGNLGAGTKLSVQYRR